MTRYSLYFHIPFCKHRCGYCDFNTYAGKEDLIPSYVDALCKEISWGRDELNQSSLVHTIFFGGGTPSLLSPGQFEKIIDSIDQSFTLASNAETTLEANPGTVTLENLRAIRKLEFNRISFGMQSSQPGELRLLERQHDFLDVIQAVQWARQAGFDNINLDLIFGLPGQSLDSWKKSLKSALSLQPEHLALYALSIEHGTPFHHWNRRGIIETIDDDLAAEMYDLASDTLVKHGYTQYEISNWAKHPPGLPLGDTQNPKYACQHNLQYWRNLPYIGFGAGAHGFANGIRTANVLSPNVYIQRLNSPAKQDSNLATKNFPYTPATIEAQPIGQKAEIGETLMMGLRLTREGIPLKTFEDRFQQSLLDIFPMEISRFEKLNLLEWTQPEKTHIRLTPKGHLLGNQVFQAFI